MKRKRRTPAQAADALAVLAEALHARPECAAQIRAALEGAADAGQTLRQLLAAFDAGTVGAELAADLLHDPDERPSTLVLRIWETLTAPERRAFATLARAERRH